VIVRALLLNGIGGIVFGWLYWKRGLLAAMLAHFSADVVLHVVVPLLGTSG
jgi:membrane protease YdiL (CAAX protease family)